MIPTENQLNREAWVWRRLESTRKWRMRKRRRIPSMVYLSIGLKRVELYKHFVRPGWKRVNKKLTVFADDDEKASSRYGILL